MADKESDKGKRPEGVLYDFIAKMNIGLTLSGIVIICCIIALSVKGLNYGIDFKGGSIFHYRFDGDISEDKIRNLLKNSPLKKELGEVVVQRVLSEVDLGIDLIGEKDKVEKADGDKGGKDRSTAKKKTSTFIIHTEASKEVSESEDVEPKLQALFQTIGKFQKLQRQFIGPTVGKTLQTNALWALIIAIIGILLYISVRFEFTYAVAAVVALVHDSLIVLGLFCLMEKEINIGIMAALLTIIGYSLNDSIVVLDRIRENNRLKGRMPFDARVNLSLNQSLSRTINTSVTTLLAVLSLLVLGGVVIYDFALAMTIGVVVGTYSSIFIVSPILVKWYYRDHPNAPRVNESI